MIAYFHSNISAKNYQQQITGSSEETVRLIARDRGGIVTESRNSEEWE